MEEPKLGFVGSNPGAVRHGNFINYYEFHPAQERIQNLPTDIWSLDTENKENFVALDIGCNTGELTVELLNFLKMHLKANDKNPPKICMVGVDIDPALINRAQEKFGTSIANIEFNSLDAAKEESGAEFNKIAERLCVPKFGAVFLMSVTMWVHLVNGDEDFHLFLKKCASLTDRWLVIESQPWKCYRSAQRRLVSSGDLGFPFYSSLQIKGDKLQPYVDKVLLEECDMDKIFETQPSKWNRTICIYKKR